MEDRYTAAQIKWAIKETSKITGAKGKKLYGAIRIATFGKQHGPDLASMLSLLPKTEVINRLDKAISMLAGGANG